MVSEMGSLIIVPQYPTKMRYQEWWFVTFPHRFKEYFDDVTVLGKHFHRGSEDEGTSFAPLSEAIRFETYQINQYFLLNLSYDDVLLLCDLSYPGLFANALFHKKPKKCFAICHGTSKNRYDYFSSVREIKYPVEKATSKLFDKIFVASKYHADKLGWSNLVVQPFPLPPFYGNVGKVPTLPIISVARNTIQKTTSSIEKEIEKAFKHKICHAAFSSWLEYYGHVANAKIMLITSKEETYGYQVIDAISNGCIPVAPNHFSYPELLPKNYLYNTIGEAIRIIIKGLSGELPVPELLVRTEARLFYQNLAIHMKE